MSHPERSATNRSCPRCGSNEGELCKDWDERTMECNHRRTLSEKRLTGDLVTDVIGILESKPDRSPAWAEWVWWEAGPDGGFRVGPRDKGCIAIVFTIEEAQELCKTVNTAMRALLAERGEMALKLAGAECFIEEQRKKGNIK